MPLLCDRPHARFLDFRTSRFVVADAYGLKLATGHVIGRGEEVPRETFDADTLRCLYELHRIETLEFAAEIPELREACARSGVPLDQNLPASQPAKRPLRRSSAKG